MSRSLNKASLIGNLGSDPEVRTTTGGAKVATFSLATSRQWNSANGEKQEKTEWHRCVVWKGDRLYVEGRIEYRQWQDKENQTRYTTEINVRDLLMLGGGSGGGRGSDFDSESEGSRSRAPARSGSRSGQASSDTNFEDFPAALEDQDDDLPF